MMIKSSLLFHVQSAIAWYELERCEAGYHPKDIGTVNTSMAWLNNCQMVQDLPAQVWKDEMPVSCLQ